MERKGRELYASVGLAQIPHILGMVDRHKLSPTYGCFDRSYWHYRTASFPSGMFQEFVLPLALVFRFPFPGGEEFFGHSRLRELVEAGIRFAARSSHRDGSCDDYFPYERALGAAAFSLYAMTESYKLLEFRDSHILEFFKKRGGWLATHQESGRLSNHQALVVLTLENLFILTGEERFHRAARERLRILLGWQSAEGWFPEYQGCDPGYLTATIDFLAKYESLSGDEEVRGALTRAIDFSAHFMHPGGAYGGEYGSRNTYIFFPHGLELSARFHPTALELADGYLSGLARGQRAYLDDDRMCAHLAYNHLQAYLDFQKERSGRVIGGMVPERDFTRYFPDSRLFVHRTAKRHLVVSGAKGGVVSLHVDGQLAYADSGLVARLSDGKVLVSHLVDDYQVLLGENSIEVQGHFGVARFRLARPDTQALFHLGMLLVGRWGSDSVRRLLQRLLILGKRRHPMRFRRSFHLGERVSLVDEIWMGNGRRERVEQLFAGTDHTSIYVAMSRFYRPGCLLPWTDYGEILSALNTKGYGRLERIIG